MSNKLVFLGNIVSSTSIETIEVSFGYICVNNGTICEIGKYENFMEANWPGYRITHLQPDQFLMPGFVDCHTHAPQFPNIGLGLDLPLLEWLDKYTFPLEKKYEDTDFAAKVYDKVVRSLLNNGTTTACYFGSLHMNGTLELTKSAMKHHQRAFIGKVSMNIENEAGYYNETKAELEEVERFVKQINNYNNELVQPVITPRFAVSCDRELMTGLSALAKKYDCRIQSHVSENKKEIEYVLNTFTDCSTYSEVYNRSSIFEQKCILAHAVYLSDEEMSTYCKKGVSVAHCPASNTRLKSGLCPVKKLLSKNVVVGLGTDVAGGDSASILDAMRRAMDVSAHLEMQEGREQAIDWKEAFYLATRGGAKALFLDKVGSFEVSHDFDALIVDVYNGTIDDYGYPVAKGQEHILHLLQKFIYVGDDRNIVQVYVKGEKVKDISARS